MKSSILALSIFICVSTAQEEPCPKYETCKLGDADLTKPVCEEYDEKNPCPGGRPSCFLVQGRDKIHLVEQCCCIKYNPKYDHLTTGAPKPERNEEKLRFYFMQYCPYCHRVGLITGFKNVSTDFIYVNLKEKPEWFKQLSNTVPTLETNDGVLNGSIILSDYFDETYPTQGELYPSNTFLKAKDRILVEAFSNVVPGIFSDIVTGKGYKNPPEIPAHVQRFEEELVKVENELGRRGTKYFNGNDGPGMVDFMIWPWFERRPVIEVFYPDAVNYNRTSQTLATWIDLMKNQDSVKNYALAPQLFYEFYQSIRKSDGASLNYNLLVGPIES